MLTPMRALQPILIDQCGDAGDIREKFGLQKGLGHLVAGKLLNVLSGVKRVPTFPCEESSRMVVRERSD
jgi:hypothetical protein